MQTLSLTFPASRTPVRRCHVGVVGSGDLEVLLEPAGTALAEVRVRTTVEGFDLTWRHVLAGFFARYPVAGRYELNDFGATPGVVGLRLLQAVTGSGA